MAAPYNPPNRGEDFQIHIAVEDAANPGNFKANPTIAANDFKVSKDGGALANLTTLPVVEPAGSIWIKIALSATEMDAANVAIQGIDQDGTKEWSDWAECIVTS